MIEKMASNPLMTGNNVLGQFRQALAAFSVSFIFSIAISALIYFFQRKGFPIMTDIIGYPSFQNYNNFRPFYSYLVGILAFCISLICIQKFRSGYWEDFSTPRISLVIYSFVVSITLCAIYGQSVYFGFLTVFFVINGLDAILYKRKTGIGSILNKLSIPIVVSLTTPLLLHLASNRTIWNTENGSIHLHWFSIGVSLAVSALFIFIAIEKMRGGDSETEILDWLVKYLVVPCYVYLYLIGVLGNIVVGDGDWFHWGEKAVPLSMWAKDGALPWRDFLFVHGVWDDFLKYIPGMLLWEKTLRAGFASHGILIAPVYWVCMYYCMLVINRSNMMLAIIGLSVAYAIYSDPFRFQLYPVILIFLYKSLTSYKFTWVSGFCVLTTLQVLIAPEFGLLSVPLGMTLLMYHYNRDRSYQKIYRLIQVAGLTFFISISTALYILDRGDLLDGFLITIRQFSRGHAEAGGIPIAGGTELYQYLILMVFFIFFSITFFAISRKKLAKDVAQSWVVIGITGCTVVYFFKFFGRPDMHIMHVVAVAVPGIGLIAALLLKSLYNYISDYNYSPSFFKKYISAIVLTSAAAMIIITPESQNIIEKITLKNLPSRLSANSSDQSLSSGLAKGIVITKNEEQRVKNISEHLASILKPGDAIFDFSDSPALYYAVLGYRPASRFIHASLAIRPETQLMVIQDLEKVKPNIVVYQSNKGLNGWDGPSNDIRHHLLANFIQKNYVYESTVDGAIFFKKRDPGVGSHIKSYLQKLVALSACNYSYLPNFYKINNNVSVLAVQNLPISQSMKTSDIVIKGWISSLAHRDQVDVVVIANGNLAYKLRPDVLRGDVNKAYGRDMGLTGFNARFSLNGQYSYSDIKIRASNDRTNKISEIGEDGLIGHIDEFTVHQGKSYRVQMPKELNPQYLKLSFEQSELLSANRDEKILIEWPAGGGMKMEFSLLHGSENVILPMGGCYAWHINSQEPFFTVITQGAVLSGVEAIEIDLRSK